MAPKLSNRWLVCGAIYAAILGIVGPILQTSAAPGDPGNGSSTATAPAATATDPSPVVPSGPASAPASAPPTAPAAGPPAVPASGPTSAPASAPAGTNALPNLQVGSRVSGQRQAVAVLDLAQTAASAALANQLAEQLLTNSGLAPVADPSIAAALVAKDLMSDAERIVSATRILGEAEELLARFENAAAIAKVTSGTAELDLSEPTGGARSLYASLAFVAGRAALNDKNTQLATRWFALASRIDSEFAPAPGRFVSSVINLFAAAKKLPQTTGTLSIVGDGDAFVDGVAVGPSPREVVVSTGPHWVVLTSVERMPSGQQVDVGPSGARVVLDGKLAPTPVIVARLRSAVRNAKDSAGRGSAMTKLAAIAGVRAAILIDQDPAGSLTLTSWRDQAPGFSPSVAASERAGKEMLNRFAPPPENAGSGSNALPPGLGSNSIVIPLPPKRHTPWYQRRWVQASIVGGIVASAIGIAFGANYQPGTRTLGQLDWQ